MATRLRNRDSHRGSIRFDGRDYSVIERLKIRRRTYLVLDNVGNNGRDRYLAFDPHAGPKGDFRAILALPRTSSTEQHIQVLNRLAVANRAVPRMVDYAAEPDRLLVVLDWVQGPTLRECLDAAKHGQASAPSPNEVFRLFKGLAHDLAWMYHKRGIIHGDVKPANIIVAQHRSSLVLVDYGSAWLVESSADRAAGDGLDPTYSAPELKTDSPVPGFAADQFSASVVLYEMLTLKRPYRLGGKAGWPEYVDEFAGTLKPPSRLSRYRKKLPRSLWNSIDRVVTTGVALAPNERYPNRKAWLDELDRVHLDMRRLAEESQLTPVESALTRFVGWLTKGSGSD